ncbi:MAG: FxLYD domain-containing protein [bacterium]
MKRFFISAIVLILISGVLWSQEFERALDRAKALYRAHQYDGAEAEIERALKILRDEKGRWEEAQKERFVSAGGGFGYRHIKFGDAAGFVEVTGEMMNDSGRNYTLADFAIIIYDRDGNFLTLEHIVITNFKNGEVKSFRLIAHARPEFAKRYIIRFEEGIEAQSPPGNPQRGED